MHMMLTRTKRKEVEDEQDWIGEASTMPFIRYPDDWEIQMLLPYGGVDVRFVVRLPSGLEKSVFLDSRCIHARFYENGKAVPYWEVSPVKGEKYGRCSKDNVDVLLELIAYEDGE